MNQNWIEDAICPSVLNRVNMCSDNPEEIDKAKSVCRRCPVKFDCASHAMENREAWGVWGGTEDWQRRRALGMDSFGSPKVNVYDIWCPFCQSKDILIERKRNQGGYHSQCNRCSLEWKTYRLPVKVRRALKRRRERQIAKNVETSLG